MAEVAQRTGAIINAVMLGALAASDRLPISGRSIRSRDPGGRQGRSRPICRGFRAGLEAARQAAETPTRGSQRYEPSHKSRKRTSLRIKPRLVVSAEIIGLMPQLARGIVTEGVRRLSADQCEAYAQLYLDRLCAIRLADERIGAGGRLVAETARHLACGCLMKTLSAWRRPRSIRRVSSALATDMGLRTGDPISISEFLKPGVDELCSILAPAPGAWPVGNRETPCLVASLALGHGGKHCFGDGIPCASGRWRNCGAGAPAPIVTKKSSAPSRAGCRSSAMPHSSQPNWRLK